MCSSAAASDQPPVKRAAQQPAAGLPIRGAMPHRHVDLWVPPVPGSVHSVEVVERGGVLAGDRGPLRGRDVVEVLASASRECGHGESSEPPPSPRGSFAAAGPLDARAALQRGPRIRMDSRRTIARAADARERSPGPTLGSSRRPSGSAASRAGSTPSSGGTHGQRRSAPSSRGCRSGNRAKLT